MRLKYVKVYGEGYKNLKDFEINFDEEKFIDVFVGKNGSGKSNFFEALIKIFHHLYKGEQVEFNFILKYEVNTTAIDIKWENNELFINNRKRVRLASTPFPNNVIVYYSGHNKQVSSLLDKYKSMFGSGIKTANIDDSRFFVGIGPEYKEILLAVLLLQNDTNKAKEFLINQLNINSLGMEIPGESDLTDPVIKIVLKRPKYATSNFYDIEDNDETDQFWKAEGIVKDFLIKLSSCSENNFDGLEVAQGYIYSDEKYVFHCKFEAVQNEFTDMTLKQLFNQFDNLKTIGMLESVSIPLKLENGLSGNIIDFSDGQFQSIYIYALTEIFKELDSITLLDEPDAFLHPEWQYKFLDQLYDITDTASKNNHILMSSHSAITLVNYRNRNIRMFVFESNQIKNRNVNKKFAVDQLSARLLKYREDEQILSIIRNINIERLPILFTEGSTDPDIIRVAWEKLYTEPMPFIPLYAFKCDYLRQLIQDQRILNELRNKAIFALFDFDEAYNEWFYLKSKDTWDDFEDNPYKGLCTGIESNKTYAFVIPVPEIEQIERQVIINKTEKTHYKHESKMEIEHLFYNAPNTSEYFETIIKPGGAQIIEVKTNKKTKFAKEVVPYIDESYFRVLKPMLDFIKNRCN